MSTRNEAISNANFDRLRALIQHESGIALSTDKKTMLEIRLKRRLGSLGVSSIGEYCDRLFSRAGIEDELVHLIDAVTTNKTDFFREAGHFEYLVSRALPDLCARNGTARKYFAWSAGCSTGEEPYTLAMVLSEYSQQVPAFRFSLLATDICTEVLAKAAAGNFQIGVGASSARLTFAASTSCAAATRNPICCGSSPNCAQWSSFAA